MRNPPAPRQTRSLIAASGVPGFDHQVVGGLAEAHDDELGDVGAEQVRGPGRRLRCR